VDCGGTRPARCDDPLAANNEIGLEHVRQRPTRLSSIFS
jgi:hypothetical protein